MVFTYRKSNLYRDCLIGLLMIAGITGYVLTRGTPTILTWPVAAMLAVLTIRSFAHTREKIVLTDDRIKWIRLWRTTEFPLTEISNFNSYTGLNGTWAEFKTQSGRKIRFTTEITGFNNLCREINKAALRYSL